MDTIEAIRTRRSIRKYKPDPVDDNDLNTVLEAALWAPSWANTQCCRFIVVKDPEIKEKVSATLQKIRFEDGWVENAAAKAIIQAPVLVVACAQRGLAGFQPDGNPATSSEDWLLFDVALSIENLCLAARNLGLGTVIVGAFDSMKAGEVLGLPDGFTVVTMTPVGYPDQTGQPPPRRSLDEAVFKDRYGNT